LSYLTLADSDGITTVMLDRPPANAITVEVLGELVGALEQLAAEPPRAIVLAGREGFFSAGVDLKAVPGYGPAEQRQMVEGINGMAIATYGMPCPVVGALTGHAIAGGLVLDRRAIRPHRGEGRRPVPTGGDHHGPRRAPPARCAAACARQRTYRRA
jgi:enoyl-CoA hydratase